MGVPLEIRTKESADTETLKQNVLTNIKLINNWMGSRYETHMNEAHIVSFGDSFREDPAARLEEMREDIKDLTEYDIFTIKHALPLFEKLDTKPKYCVLLDPRDVEGTSTLGYKRSDLLKVYPETTYLVASMTHPSVTRYLLDKGAKVVGWHSACEAMNDPEVSSQITEWTVGGSCSAMRAISIARILGYRRIKLSGFDAKVQAPAHYLEKEKKKIHTLLSKTDIKLNDKDMDTFVTQIAPAFELYGSKKITKLLGEKSDNVVEVLEHIHNPISGKLDYMKVLIGNDLFWTTPELAAIAQDLVNTFKNNTDVSYGIYSGGACASVWNALGGSEAINPKGQEERTF